MAERTLEEEQKDKSVWNSKSRGTKERKLEEVKKMKSKQREDGSNRIEKGNREMKTGKREILICS